MKAIILALILVLILTTSLVKNSTKEVEDKIYNINENIRSLKAELSNTMLEYNYLSSPEKLIQHQSKYFENNLVKIDIINIKKITLNKQELKITNLINEGQINE
jgi:cell division protein FtsL